MMASIKMTKDMVKESITMQMVANMLVIGTMVIIFLDMASPFKYKISFNITNGGFCTSSMLTDQGISNN